MFWVTMQCVGQFTKFIDDGTVIVRMFGSDTLSQVLEAVCEGNTFIADGSNQYGEPVHAEITECSYWNDNGRYQSLYNLLRKVAHPVLQTVERLYYDLYNNGGGNFDVLCALFATLPQEVKDTQACKNILEFWNTSTQECETCGGGGYFRSPNYYSVCDEECPDCDGFGEHRITWLADITPLVNDYEGLADYAIIYVARLTLAEDEIACVLSQS